MPPPVEVVDPTPRILGPISVIGDSVLRGALVSPPHLVDRLAEQGWGPIRALGVPGLSTGHAFRSPELTAAFWVERWKQQGWDPDAVALIIGANDVGLCAFYDTVCMSGSQRFIVDRIGSGHDIFIPHINHWYKNEWAAPWNRALDRLVDERPNVHTWAWDVELATGGYDLDDVVHLTPNSYRRWSVLTADEITLALGRPTFRGDNVTLPAPLASGAEFGATDPVRLADTRADQVGRLGDGRGVLRVPLPDVVSDTATAVAVYIAATGADTRGYLQIAGCGQPRPETSVVNYPVRQAQGAASVVAVDATRELCVYSSGPVHVVMDLQGVFSPDAGSTLQPSTPTRRLDTRTTGRATVVELPIGGDTTAVAINVTATNASARGYLTAHPCGQPRPMVATVNFAPGRPVASSAFVAADATRRICVYSSSPVDVIVDQTGAFSEGDGLRFVAVPPTRVLDTRTGAGGWVPFVSDHRPIDVLAVPPGAAAVTGSIVIVRPRRRGYLIRVRVWQPAGDVVGERVRGGRGGERFHGRTSGTGRLCVSASQNTDAIVDISGWWVADGG